MSESELYLRSEFPYSTFKPIGTGGMNNNRNRPVTIAEITAAITALPSILPPNYVEQQQLKGH